ncbi:MAG: hypothetical protein AAGE59_34865 [Cyanobacteria bacterium P01_F01_bin.86]
MPTGRAAGQAAAQSTELARGEGQAAGALIATMMSNIRANLDRLLQQKQQAREGIVTVADKLSDPQHQSAPNVRGTPDLSPYQDSKEAQAIAKDWSTATRTVQNHAHDLPSDKLQALMEKMNRMRQRLGDVGLIAAVTKHVEREGRYYVKLQSIEQPSQAVEPEKSLESSQNPNPQLSADVQNVIQVADTLLQRPQRQPPITQTASAAYEAPSQSVASKKTELRPENVSNQRERNTYYAEAVTISQIGNRTLIQSYANEILFDYTRETDGTVIINKDLITNNSALNQQFQQAAAVLQQTSLQDINRDSSGRTQAEALGDLAPSGSHALAVASYVTAKNPVESTNQYTFSRNSDGFRVSKHTDERGSAIPPDRQLVAISGSGASSHGFVPGRQTPKDYKYMKDTYGEIRQAVKEHQQSQATAAYQKPTLKSRVTSQSIDRGGR